ncbi:MAG: TM2 domain-containing protein [Coriobacteriia bacterium]|nr:TM2 domain-containing protein [Coriobacteriia bacterium]
MSENQGSAPQKSFLATWLLSMILGSWGADRFYLGKIGTGVLKLLTAGGLGIWYIVDLVIVLAGNTTDKNGLALEGYEENKKTAWIVTAIYFSASIVLGIILGLAYASVLVALLDTGAFTY